MKIYKSILIAALTIFTIGTAISQSTQSEQHLNKEERKKMSPEERADKRVKRMTEKLSLTDDQAKKIHAMQIEFAQEEKADREAMKAKRVAQKAEIRAMLTDEQIVKFDKMEAKHKERRKAKKGKRGGKRKGPNQDEGSQSFEEK